MRKPPRISVSQRTLGLFQSEGFAVSLRVVMSQLSQSPFSLPRRQLPRQTSSGKNRLPSSGCVLQHAPEQTLELTRVRAAEPAQEAVLNRHRDIPQARIHRAPLLGHLEVDEPAILRAAGPADETLALQAVDHPGHGPGVVRHLLAEVGGRLL